MHCVKAVTPLNLIGAFVSLAIPEQCLKLSHVPSLPYPHQSTLHCHSVTNDERSWYAITYFNKLRKSMHLKRLVHRGRRTDGTNKSFHRLQIDICNISVVFPSKVNSDWVICSKSNPNPGPDVPPENGSMSPCVWRSYIAVLLSSSRVRNLNCTAIFIFQKSSSSKRKYSRNTDSCKLSLCAQEQNI
jgi:hypothetical protein